MSDTGFKQGTSGDTICCVVSWPPRQLNVKRSRISWSVKRGNYFFLSENAHQMFNAIWNQLTTVKYTQMFNTVNIIWHNRTSIYKSDDYLRELLWYGAGWPSIRLSVSLSISSVSTFQCIFPNDHPLIGTQNSGFLVGTRLAKGRYAIRITLISYADLNICITILQF